MHVLVTISTQAHLLPEGHAAWILESTKVMTIANAIKASGAILSMYMMSVPLKK
ncbi:MAG: hypothetical protein U0941_14220 [Planctomycetaceae bacterium]